MAHNFNTIEGTEVFNVNDAVQGSHALTLDDVKNFVGVDKFHSNIVATAPYDPLLPLTGWVAPSSPIAGNTVEVKFTDGTVANYTFDGSVWVLDFVDDTSTARRPWVKVGETEATSTTPVTKDNDIFHTGKVVIGTEDSTDYILTVSSSNDKGLNLNTNAIVSDYNYLKIEGESVQNSSFPSWQHNLRRHDGQNLPLSSLPNYTNSMGWYKNSVDQVTLEDAWEYNYSYLGHLSAERHIEFRPANGAVTQRWISWAGRHDGTRTDASIVGNQLNILKSNNNQILKIEEQGDQIPTTFRAFDGIEFISQNVLNPYPIFSNGININGQCRIFGNDGEAVKIGKVGNQNDVIIYGNPNGTILRLTSAISTQTWGHNMWAGGYLISNASTGASPIVIENAATDSSIRIKSNRVEVGVPITLSQTFATDGSGAQNGSLFKGTDGALYYKGDGGTVTLVAPN